MQDDPLAVFEPGPDFSERRIALADFELALMRRAVLEGERGPGLASPEKRGQGNAERILGFEDLDLREDAEVVPQPLALRLPVP